MKVKRHNVRKISTFFAAIRDTSNRHTTTIILCSPFSLAEEKSKQDAEQKQEDNTKCYPNNSSNMRRFFLSMGSLAIRTLGRLRCTSWTFVPSFSRWWCSRRWWRSRTIIKWITIVTAQTQPSLRMIIDNPQKSIYKDKMRTITLTWNWVMTWAPVVPSLWSGCLQHFCSTWINKKLTVEKHR